MPRPLRIEYEGAICHVINRGDRREPNFRACQKEYLKAPRQRWPWLQVDRLFGEMGLPKDSPAGRREFERQTEARRRQKAIEKQELQACATAIRRRRALAKRAQVNAPENSQKLTLDLTIFIVQGE